MRVHIIITVIQTRLVVYITTVSFAGAYEFSACSTSSRFRGAGRGVGYLFVCYLPLFFIFFFFYFSKTETYVTKFTLRRISFSPLRRRVVMTNIVIFKLNFHTVSRGFRCSVCVRVINAEKCIYRPTRALTRRDSKSKCPTVQ